MDLRLHEFTKFVIQAQIVKLCNVDYEQDGISVETKIYVENFFLHFVATPIDKDKKVNCFEKISIKILLSFMLNTSRSLQVIKVQSCFCPHDKRVC